MSADNSSDHEELELFSNEESEDIDTEDEPATLNRSACRRAGKRDRHLVVSETNNFGGDEGGSSINSSYTQLSPSVSERVTPLSRKSGKGKYTSSTSSRKGSRDSTHPSVETKTTRPAPKSLYHQTPNRKSVNSVPESRIIISDKNQAVSQDQTLKVLEKNNSLLLKLFSRVKNTEKHIRRIEEKIDSSSHSSSGSNSSTPRGQKSRMMDVPNEVKVSFIVIFSLQSLCCSSVHSYMHSARFILKYAEQ